MEEEVYLATIADGFEAQHCISCLVRDGHEWNSSSTVFKEPLENICSLMNVLQSYVYMNDKRFIIDGILKSVLCDKIPSTIVKRVIAEAFSCWEILSKETEGSSFEYATDYWRKFKKFVNLLHSSQLFIAIMGTLMSEFVQKKVEEEMRVKCSSTYDESMMEYLNHLNYYLVNWLTEMFDGATNSQVLLEEWSEWVKQCCFRNFSIVRISQLFEIIIEYPDSRPALEDLTICLKEIDGSEEIISFLNKSFRTRLLHPGVNTADIITQYVACIKALKIVYPRGEVLERVCTPIKEYLYQRDDTVRCIVSSLTNDNDGDLADVLIKDGSVDDSDSEDVWLPEPYNATPADYRDVDKHSDDIIKLLVNIYGSCEMFESEYRNLLADRLLQMCSFDISREMCTLELLKRRFGENSLHFCEVMLKDLRDSRRIYNSLSTSLEENSMSEPQLHGIIVSSEFWPTFREEQFQVPEFVKRRLSLYSEEFQRLKGMRKLDWRMYLGCVEIEVVCGEQVLTTTVSPIRAVLLHHFQTQNKWSIESLAHQLKTHPSVVRKHIGFWVSQGLLREVSCDVYGLIDEWKFVNKASVTQMSGEDDSLMATEDTIEAELQIYWNYITHMLTNLGPLSLDKIHSMLGMFGQMGQSKKTLGLSDLRAFLNKKTLHHELRYDNSLYALPS